MLPAGEWDGATGMHNANAESLYAALQTVQNAANLQWPESDPANAEVRAEFRFGKFPPKHNTADRLQNSGEKIKICVSVHENNWNTAVKHWKKKTSWLVDKLVARYVNSGGSILETSQKHPENCFGNIHYIQRTQFTSPAQ